MILQRVMKFLTKFRGGSFKTEINHEDTETVTSPRLCSLHNTANRTVGTTSAVLTVEHITISSQTLVRRRHDSRASGRAKLAQNVLKIQSSLIDVRKGPT
jgi:hypothetical protein